jgi:hypothetical protein
MALGDAPVVVTFTLKDSVSSQFGNLDGTTYCNLLTPTSFSFRYVGWLNELAIAIGSVSVAGMSAEISFDPDLTHIGSNVFDLYAILNGVESLLFSSLTVLVE